MIKIFEEIDDILEKSNLIPKPKHHASKYTFRNEHILVF
jgi:hypothetical protein